MHQLPGHTTVQSFLSYTVHDSSSPQCYHTELELPPPLASMSVQTQIIYVTDRELHHMVNINKIKKIVLDYNA